MTRPDPTAPAVYTPQPAPAALTDPFAGLVPALPTQMPVPVSATAVMATRMTVQEVVLRDGRTDLAYVAAPAPVTVRPAYRATEDPLVMRSAAGGVLLTGGGIASWGVGSLVQSVGHAVEAVGHVAAPLGGLVLSGAVLLGLWRSLGPATAAAAAAGGSGCAGAGTRITNDVQMAPQQVIHARRVRIRNLTANQSLEF